jgi:beta-phosphoglucomutase
VSADDVEVSKPHPETFLKAAALLNCPPEECLVFEDAPKGVETALHAGMSCIVLTTMHNRDEFPAPENIIAFIKDYTDPVIESLF